MRNDKRLKTGITLIYLATLCVMTVGLALALHNDWRQRYQNTVDNLSRCNKITSTQFKSAVIDASKVIDLARIKLQQTSVSASLTPEIIHQVLTDTMQSFSLYNQSDFYGLLFFVDQAGQLVTAAGEENFAPINFSDRYYFTDLRDHPDKVMTIGPLLRAKTTGKLVFHVAMPYLDGLKAFSGVLVLQVNLENFSALLDQETDEEHERIEVLLPNGLVAFSHSNSVIDANPQDRSAEATLAEIAKKPLTDVAIESHRMLGHIPPGRVIVCDSLPEIGITTVVSQSKAHIIWHFIQANSPLLLLTGLGTLITGVLFYRLLETVDQLTCANRFSHQDPLTKIGNRRALDSLLANLVSERRKRERSVCALFLDIDGFKHFNDEYGHEDGDNVLLALAEALKSSLLRPEDFCCRWGGEEFVVIMPDTSIEGGIHMAQRISDAIQRLEVPVHTGIKTHITCSIGIAVATSADENFADVLIDKADKAMYIAKRFGKDTYAVFEPAHQ